MSDETIPMTQRYVVPPDARRRLAWASVRFTLVSSRAQQLFYASIIGFALLLQTLKGWSPPGAALREVGVFVVIGLVAAVLWVVTVGFAQTFSSTRDTFRAGSVLESGFGPDAFVLRGPTGDQRLPYDRRHPVRLRGDFVFFSLGLGAYSFFPRELFPDEQVARINEAVAAPAADG